MKFADARACKGAQSGHSFQRPKERQRSLVDSGFSGSPSFVAVMQSTDLRHCHDGPHFRRLNRS